MAKDADQGILLAEYINEHSELGTTVQNPLQLKAKSAKGQTWEITEGILNTDAARPPRRRDGRFDVTELARQVQSKWPPKGKLSPLGTIERYIRTYVRQWEEQNPDK
jgi:hypothetical protein